MVLSTAAFKDSRSREPSPCKACEGARCALVEAADEVAELLAEARPNGAAGGAVGLLVRQVLRQLLHQRAPTPLQQDHQVCSKAQAA